MKTQIIDMSILAKIFSTYSYTELKQWGIPTFKTIGIDIPSMYKRVFILQKLFTTDNYKLILYFQSPQKEIATVMFYNHPIIPEDIIKITYTVIAHPSDGPSSIIFKWPNGKIERISFYCLAG